MNQEQPETQEELSTFTQPQDAETVLGEITLAKVIDSGSNEIRYPCDVKNGRDNLSEMDYKMFIYTLATMAAQFDNKGPLQIIEETKISSIPGGSDLEYFAGDVMCESEEVVLTDEQAEAELATGENAEGTEFADYSDTSEVPDTQEGTMDWSFDK